MTGFGFVTLVCLPHLHRRGKAGIAAGVIDGQRDGGLAKMAAGRGRSHLCGLNRALVFGPLTHGRDSAEQSADAGSLSTRAGSQTSLCVRLINATLDECATSGALPFSPQKIGSVPLFPFSSLCFAMNERLLGVVFFIIILFLFPSQLR